MSLLCHTTKKNSQRYSGDYSNHGDIWLPPHPVRNFNFSVPQSRDANFSFFLKIDFDRLNRYLKNRLWSVGTEVVNQWIFKSGNCWFRSERPVGRRVRRDQLVSGLGSDGDKVRDRLVPESGTRGHRWSKNQYLLYPSFSDKFRSIFG